MTATHKTRAPEKVLQRKSFLGKGEADVKAKRQPYRLPLAQFVVLRRGGAAGTCTPVLRRSDALSTYLV